MRLTVLLATLCALMWGQTTWATPERVVTGDGSLTEIVYALEASSKLAGVDTTSTYPEAAAELPQIGYKRAISVEGVLSLSPDVLIITEDSGPPKSLNQLQQAGLEIKTFSAAPTVDTVREKILGVAQLLEKQAEGEVLWQQVSAKIEAARLRVKNIDKPLRVMFVLSMSEKSPMVAGQSTSAEQMIEMAGGVNAVTGIEGFKPITPEAVAAANPDVILMMSRREHSVSADQLFSQPGFKLTNAAKQQRLVTMDGMYLLGFGPRIGDALEELSQHLYPQLETVQQ